MTGALLSRRTAVVTGATRGLGRAFARALAGAGAAVAVNGRDAAAVDGLVAEITGAGGKAIGVAGSVADEQVADALIGRCVSELGGIDLLINNAGVTRDRTLLKMTADEFDDVVATSLRGTFLCGRRAAQAMRDRGGAILNVVSNVAFHGSVGQSNYAAAKAGIAGLTRAWSFELARYGIRVNALWPIADTEMTQVVIDREARAAAGRGEPAPTPREIGLGAPDAVAPIVVYLASDDARHLTGQIITFNGTRLALWTHPREAVVERREGWRVEDLPRCFEAEAFAPQEMYVPQIGLPRATQTT